MEAPKKTLTKGNGEINQTEEVIFAMKACTPKCSAEQNWINDTSPPHTHT